MIILYSWQWQQTYKLEGIISTLFDQICHSMNNISMPDDQSAHHKFVLIWINTPARGQLRTSIDMFANVVAVIILIERGRRGDVVVRGRMRQSLRGLEGKEEAARRGEKGRRAGVGNQGGAEEGGEACEEVERRAAEQREDLVGRERFRVARHALPSRRRPPGHGHHPPRPHRHESKSAPKLNRRPPRHLASPARRVWMELDWVL
jgi:hypothetical protein